MKKILFYDGYSNNLFYIPSVIAKQVLTKKNTFVQNVGIWSKHSSFTTVIFVTLAGDKKDYKKILCLGVSLDVGFPSRPSQRYTYKYTQE